MRYCDGIGHIYCIRCLANGKLYIGQTVKSLNRRFNQHIAEAKRGGRTKLHRAIRKYGEENFTVEEVMWVEAPTKQALKAKLDFLEIHFIQKFDTRRNGYNTGEGGEGHSQDAHPLYGKHRSREVREKISRSLKGRPLSPEHRRHISQTEKGKFVSEETRRKISEARKRQAPPHVGKRADKLFRRKIV